MKVKIALGGALLLCVGTLVAERYFAGCTCTPTNPADLQVVQALADFGSIMATNDYLVVSNLSTQEEGYWTKRSDGTFDVSTSAPPAATSSGGGGGGTGTGGGAGPWGGCVAGCGPTGTVTVGDPNPDPDQSGN